MNTVLKKCKAWLIQTGLYSNFYFTLKRCKCSLFLDVFEYRTRFVLKLFAHIKISKFLKSRCTSTNNLNATYVYSEKLL